MCKFIYLRFTFIPTGTFHRFPSLNLISIEKHAFYVYFKLQSHRVIEPLSEKMEILYLQLQ